MRDELYRSSYATHTVNRTLLDGVFANILHQIHSEMCDTDHIRYLITSTDSSQFSDALRTTADVLVGVTGIFTFGLPVLASLNMSGKLFHPTVDMYVLHMLVVCLHAMVKKTIAAEKRQSSRVGAELPAPTNLPPFVVSASDAHTAWADTFAFLHERATEKIQVSLNSSNVKKAATVNLGIGVLKTIFVAATTGAVDTSTVQHGAMDVARNISVAFADPAQRANDLALNTAQASAGEEGYQIIGNKENKHVLNEYQQCLHYLNDVFVHKRKKYYEKIITVSIPHNSRPTQARTQWVRTQWARIMEWLQFSKPDSPEQVDASQHTDSSPRLEGGTRSIRLLFIPLPESFHTYEELIRPFVCESYEGSKECNGVYANPVLQDSLQMFGPAPK